MCAKLSCSAARCVYNLNGLCSAYLIEVDGEGARRSHETQCRTFAETGFLNALTHIPNMNVLGEFKQVFTNRDIEMSPRIHCSAVYCIYNKSRICDASNVQIHGPEAELSGETDCETFREG